jgi:hypothetical protein
LPADDHVCSGLAGPFRVGVVDAGEREVGEFGDVAAVRQGRRASGHDLVGGHVVTHFDHHRGGQGVPVLVVATREELEIAAQVRATVEAST